MILGFLGFPLILFVGIVLLLLAGKAEPGLLRERPQALYLSIMTFVGVLLLFGATFLIVNGVAQLTNSKPSDFSTDNATVRIGSATPGEPQLFSRSDFNGHANHDADVSQIVGGLILGAIAAGLLWFHLPKLQRAADDSTGPGARVVTRLAYSVAGAALLTALGAAGRAAYAIYGMIAPDTAHAGGVTGALRSFVPAAVLAVAAAYVFQRAWQRTEDLNAVARAAVEGHSPPPRSAE